MSKTKKNLIEAFLKRSEESFAVAQIAVEKKFRNTAAGELYYTCFYMIQALFAVHEIQINTHSGMRTLFALKFIKEGKVEDRRSKLLSKLFYYRQEGNYGDFVMLTEADILPLFSDVHEFNKMVRNLLAQ